MAAAKLLSDDRRRTLGRLGIEDSTLDLLSTLRRSGPPYTLTTRELGERTLVTAGAISQRVAGPRPRDWWRGPGRTAAGERSP